MTIQDFIDAIPKDWDHHKLEDPSGAWRLEASSTNTRVLVQYDPDGCIVVEHEALCDGLDDAMRLVVAAVAHDQVSDEDGAA